MGTERGSDSPTLPNSLQPLELTVARLSDVGRARPHNEDYVDAHVPSDPLQLTGKGAIYLVADGMGGHQAGEVASKGAVEAAIAQYYGDTSHDTGTSLVRAFRAANQQIHERARADPSKAGMGTTLVAAVILGRKVYVANVGDSRAYLINDDGIRQITEDHSWVEEQVRANLLTPEEARRHPQRNLVTRALGTKPAVEVDLFEGTIAEGDILVLCTDGLTGLVGDPEIASAVTEQAPEDAARSLVNLANERGGTDNISLIVVSGHKPAAQAPAAATVAAKTQPQEPPSGKRIRMVAGVAGGLLAVLLALGGWFAFNRFFSGGDGPDGTVQAVAQAPSAVVSAETETPLPTASHAQGQETAEASTPLTGDATPQPTTDPSLLVATATLIPTPAPVTQTSTSPPPTRSPSAPPTASPTPKPSPQPGHPAPALLAPEQNASLQAASHFTWQYDGPSLGADQAFDLRIWSEEHESGIAPEQRRGAVTPTGETEAEIDLENVPAIRQYGPGLYYWTVVVVEISACYPGCPPTVIGEWGEAREFSYAPPGPPPAKTQPAQATEPPREP
jgi:serine/threonine protein phosphatase PrpC